MIQEQLSKITEQFLDLTKKPQNFLSVQEKKAEVSKDLLKSLYDSLKCEEAESWQPANCLDELITDGFDEEQIWQELELQNEGINDGIVKDLATLLSKKDRLVFEAPSDEENEEEEEDAEENDIDDEDIDEEFLDNEENESDIDFDGEEDIDGDEDNSDGDENEDKSDEDASEGVQFKSEVDDEFFRLCDMENFCEKVEKDRVAKSSFDFFGDTGESDEERELVRYNDFFGPAKSSDKKRGDRSRDGERRVTFAEEQFSDDGGGGENDDPEGDQEDESSEGEEKGGKTSDEKKSNFEARQERLKARIESLEEAAISEKPWFLRGEITSNKRPQNSLLQEYVEFDRAVRPAPVFTEKTTLRLEDIIKQRIKDKSWDDVVRKVKPVEDVREYRKRLVLDQEKSKVSLAEIYEQEFIKQRDSAAAASTNAEVEKEETEPAAHTEIKKMMKALFSKLDSLSNFHYTPKPVAPEIKIISNVPAITMEDVAPVATSDATLLAPEEVKHKPKGELMSKEERTTTDKNRERRKKKLKQREREKDKQKKEKLLNKLSLGLGNKYSKEKASKALDKLSKEGNVDKLVEKQSKHLNSSSAFFNKLQDEVKTQVSTKGKEAGKNKKRKGKGLVGSITAKKIKL